MQRHRRFHSGLRVELGRKRYLEQHVFHHIGTVRALELELVALEEHVVKAPRFRGQHRRIAHLARLRNKRETDCARGRVARGPRFTRAGVRRVAVRAQRLPVDERLRDRIDQLVAREADHLTDYRRRRELYQQYMIEPDLVEGVFERDAALNFVRLDHCDQHVFHRKRRFAGCDGSAREPVGCRENSAQIVRRMPPFGGEPGVVEVEPADHGPDVEGGLNGIELKRRARHLCTVGDDRARHDGSQQLGAGRVGKRLESAAERIDQTMTRGFQRERAVDLIIQNVIDDIDQDFVRIGSHVGNRSGHRGAFLTT